MIDTKPILEIIETVKQSIEDEADTVETLAYWESVYDAISEHNRHQGQRT